MYKKYPLPGLVGSRRIRYYYNESCGCVYVRTEMPAFMPAEFIIVCN